jgi:hypothetical protein
MESVSPIYFVKFKVITVLMLFFDQEKVSHNYIYKGRTIIKVMGGKQK